MLAWLNQAHSRVSAGCAPRSGIGRRRRGPAHASAVPPPPRAPAIAECPVSRVGTLWRVSVHALIGRKTNLSASGRRVHDSVCLCAVRRGQASDGRGRAGKRKAPQIEYKKTNEGRVPRRDARVKYLRYSVRLLLRLYSATARLAARHLSTLDYRRRTDRLCNCKPSKYRSTLYGYETLGAPCTG